MLLASLMGMTGMKDRSKGKKRKQNKVKIGERVTLLQRGKRGIWQMHFHFHGHRILSTKTANLKYARQRAIVVESQLFQGTYGEEQERQKPNHTKTERMKISDAKERYISQLRREGKRPKTIAKYNGILTKLESYCENQNIRWLGRLNVAVFDDYQESQKEQVGISSSQYEGGQIKRFLNWCAIRKYITENPLELMTFQKVTNKKESVLKLENVNQVLTNTSASRRYIFSMLAFTGMRISEAKHLLRKDVDLKKGWIQIVSRSGFETKTGKSWRVPLHPRLRQILLEREWPESGWFFNARPSNKFPAGDHHINPRTINVEFKEELEVLGLPVGNKEGGFTLHSLRHFFKTFCIVQGKIPKPFVDEWQGHELDTSQASNLYVHVNEEDSQKLMNSVPFNE